MTKVLKVIRDSKIVNKWLSVTEKERLDCEVFHGADILEISQSLAIKMKKRSLGEDVIIF